jgi:excisionase family DNA binding protein
MNFRLRDDQLLPWPPRESISVPRAANMLGCAGKTVRNLIEEGAIRAYKIRPDKPTSRYRIQYGSVVAYIKDIRRKSLLDNEATGR